MPSMVACTYLVAVPAFLYQRLELVVVLVGSLEVEGLVGVAMSVGHQVRGIYPRATYPAAARPSDRPFARPFRLN